MANEVKTGTNGAGGSNSVVRLIAIFLLTFFVVFVAGWIYDLFSESIESEQIEAAKSAGRPVLTIDPNIEKELSKVLAFDENAPVADLKNPFSDRSNLSDSTAARFSALPTRDQLAQADLSGSVRTSLARSGGGNASAAEEKKEEPKIDIAKVTFEAVRARDAAIRAGRDPGPESAIFFIDDLLPVGMVSGGSAPPEVLMYSITMKRTYSFPAGASFRDGWLATWRSDGVAFGDATKGGAIFLKPWATTLGTDPGSKQVVVSSGSGKDDTD